MSEELNDSLQDDTKEELAQDNTLENETKEEEKEKKKKKRSGLLGFLVDTFLVTITILFVAAVALVLVLPLLLGSVPKVILTQSMEPTFKPGDLVMIQPEPGIENIRINDIVEIRTKSGDKETYTHRVKGILNKSDGTKGLITQGDKEGAAEDAPVLFPQQVAGKVVNFPFTNRPYTIPKIGWLQAEPYRTPAIWSAGGLLTFGIGSLIFSRIKKNRLEKKRQKEVEDLMLELKRVKAEQALDKAKAENNTDS